MLNTKNDLGARKSGRGSIAFGFILAIAALAILARNGRAQEPIEVVGTVVDAENGQALVGAWVTITGSDWGSITDGSGRFRLPDLLPGPLALTVEQLGYENLAWEGEVTAAALPLQLRVNPQPVVLEGLQVVTDRFRSRRNAVATSVRAFALDDLSSSPQSTALDFVVQRTGTHLVNCFGRRDDRCMYVRGRPVEPIVYIDEAPVLGGLTYLESLAPYELYMIEVYGNGRHIRAYTPQYMERAAKQRLQPIPLLF